MKLLQGLLIVMALMGKAHACIWDAESLSHEKARSHDLASVILGETNAVDDPQKLQARIKELEASRNETNAEWWNNLAGAYLRLNQPEMAVKLLEPVIGTFTNDYGIHANLGTAYHLLGRYTQAEKEIARDLEINPEAHFGLEKYHLALLQYLVRDAKYQARHVYVDEFTVSLLVSAQHHFEAPDIEIHTNRINDDESIRTNAAMAEAMWESAKTNHDDRFVNMLLFEVASWDKEPAYRQKWILANHKDLEAGVIYMAQMNPKEPACFVMLGMIAWQKHDYNLAIKAFEKAISSGSSQSELLKQRIEDLQKYIKDSDRSRNHVNPYAWVGVTVVWFMFAGIFFLLCLLARALFRIIARS